MSLVDNKNIPVTTKLESSVTYIHIQNKYISGHEHYVGAIQYNSRSEREAVMNDYCRHRASPSDMLFFHKQGAPIVLEDPIDSVIIYDWIVKWLLEELEYISHSFYSGVVPLSVYTDWDKFADSLFEVANSRRVAGEVNVTAPKTKINFGIRLVEDNESKKRENLIAVGHTSMIPKFVDVIVNRRLKAT